MGQASSRAKKSTVSIRPELRVRGALCPHSVSPSSHPGPLQPGQRIQGYKDRIQCRNHSIPPALIQSFLNYSVSMSGLIVWIWPNTSSRLGSWLSITLTDTCGHLLRPSLIPHLKSFSPYYPWFAFFLAIFIWLPVILSGCFFAFLFFVCLHECRDSDYCFILSPRDWHREGMHLIFTVWMG